MAEKTFSQYILLAKKEFSYRLKFAFPLTEEKLACVEKCAAKYGMVEISAPKKLIAQKNPLDFKNLDGAAEVYYTDVVCEYPASTEMFRQELRQRLNVAEKLVMVRQTNDPYEQYIEEINERKETEEKGEYKTKLLDPEYKSDGHTEEQAPTHYGNEYNKKFVETLDDSRKEEKKRVTAHKKVGEAENFNSDVAKGTKSPFNDIKLPPMPPRTKG